MKVGITVNAGNYESLRFDSDDLPAENIEDGYIQIKKELEEWAGAIPRCAWWISKINQILANRGAPT